MELTAQKAALYWERSIGIDIDNAIQEGWAVLDNSQNQINN